HVPHVKPSPGFGKSTILANRLQHCPPFWNFPIFLGKSDDGDDTRVRACRRFKSFKSFKSFTRPERTKNQWLKPSLVKGFVQKVKGFVLSGEENCAKGERICAHR